MAATKEKDPRFDQVKLQGMHEPLTVRVEKMRGNVRQPIELPAKGSQETGFQPPGVGWTRDEVLQLENFILTKWSGGGYYEFTVTDAKNDRMTWTGVWDPRLYPEKIPPNTVEAAFVGASPTPAPAGPQPVPASSQPFGQSPQSGWPASFAAGFNNPPHSGPVMTAPPPVPSQMPQMPAPSQAPPMWAGGQGPFNGQQAQFPQGPWNQQTPWGSPNPWAMGWNPGYGPQGFSPFGPQGYGAPPFGPSGYPGMPGYGTRGRYDEDRRERERTRDDNDDEKRKLEQQLRALEMERKEQDYKQQLERQQLAHEQQMKLLQEEMRRLGEGRIKGEDDEVRRLREEAQRAREQQLLEQQASQRQLFETQLQMMRDQLTKLSEKPHGETDEYRRLREEQERQRQEFERQRQEQERRLEVERAERERERERYDRERRDELMQREMKESREATERRFEQLANQNRAHDPVVEALKENARLNSENMREISRMNQAQADRMSQFMVAPIQLAQIMKDNSSGADVVMRNMVETMSGIGNMYKNAAESMLQMTGGGGESPAARLVEAGIGRASEIAEKYVAMKRDQSISEAKVKQAQAQTEATRVAAEAQVRTAALHAQAGQRWAPPPPVNGAGLNGARRPQQAPAQATPASAQATPASAQQPTPPNGHSPANGNHAAPANRYAPAPTPTGPIDLPPQEASGPTPPKHTGPTEEEMFGVALESVVRLRRGVAEGKLDPEKTIDAILQGVEYVISNNLVIPAFTLFKEDRWADFIDIMLPNAPQPFKDECIRILIEDVEPDDGSGGGDDDPQVSTALAPV